MNEFRNGFGARKLYKARARALIVNARAIFSILCERGGRVLSGCESVCVGGVRLAAEEVETFNMAAPPRTHAMSVVVHCSGAYCVK